MAATPLPTVVLSSAQPDSINADVLVVDARAAQWADDLKAMHFSAKPAATLTVPTGGRAGADRVIAVEIGESATPTALRAAAGAAARAATKASHLVVDLGTDTPESVAAVVEGLRLGAYTYDRYKTASDTVRIEKVTLISAHAQRSDVLDAVGRAMAVSDAVAQARDWTNTAPSDLRPPVFAGLIADAAVAGVTATVWDETRLEHERCGGLLGVGQGSQAPPRLVRLDYRPQGATQHLALVGKGITFDSGGLSIKPGASMATMKLDMTGAAAVAAAINAIARLGLSLNVTAFACIAENMPSGSATRPGDVLTIRNGTTVEVLNTDAEGRLVLADGLSLAVEAEPDVIVDVATLTGACMVALGTRTTGVLGTDDVADEVLAAAATAGEPMWRLPLTAEMPELLKASKVADLAQHNPKPYGGAIYAAAFLREFTGGLPWAHLDIAGPSFNEGAPYGEVPSGGTGVSVRTLVEFAEALSSR